MPGESVGDDPDEEWWEGITFPTTGVLPTAEVRPSLYFTADEIPEIRARALGDRPDPNGYYAGNWERIITDADAWLAEPVSTVDDIKTKASKALAFAWIVTGDVRYRDKAVGNLMRAYEELQATDQYVALQMTNYATAYDWVMAEGVGDVAPVSTEDDQAMRDAIKIGADWMDEYLDRPGVRSHNHRSKVGAAQGSWAMAFSSDPDAQAYLDKGMENMNRVWRYMFTKDGIYRDGGGYYWIFTVLNSTPFLWHYKNAAGQDLFPALQPAFEWQLKTSNPRGWTPNNGDGSYKHTWLATVAAAYDDTATELHPTASLGELFQWRFFATDDAPVRYPDDWSGARDQYYAWPDEIVLYDSAIAEIQPDNNTGTVDFDAGPRGGATVFRSDWDYDESHTRWAYFEGTAMSNNHDHADKLQFIIDAENAILANDNGYGPQKFGGRNLWKGPENHNVITANGAALGDPLPTEHFMDSEFFDFAEKSAAYWDDPEATHTRALAFPGQEYFVVVDSLEATTEKTWVSRYHNRGKIDGAANRWQWTTEDGPWGDAARMHAMVLPASATVSTAQGEFNPYGTGEYDAGPQYPDPATDVEEITKLETTQTGTDAQYMQVLVPGTVDGNAPRFDDLSVGDVLAARVHTESGTDLFASRPSPGTVTAGELEANATFAWLRLDGNTPVQVAGRDATSLAFDGDVLVAADQAVSMALDVSDPSTWSGHVARDTEGTTGLTLTLPAGRTVASATLDGAAVTVTPGAGTATLAISGGGDLTVNFTEATEAPDAPSRLEGSYIEGAVQLIWDAVPGAVSYEVERDGAVIATVTASRMTDAEVDADATYTYRVRALNEAGVSDFSESVDVQATAGVPTAPTGLQAVASDATAALTWNPVPGANRYVVLRDGEEIADTSATNFVDTGLTNGATYAYTVVAVNEAGSSPPSAPVSATPFAEVPAAPTGLRIDRDGFDVVLSWDEAPRSTSYTVGRSTTAGGPYTTVAEGLTTSTWTDTEASDGLTYYYVVTASNDAGVSENSREGSVVAGCTPTLQVSEPTYFEAEDHSALVGEWAVLEDDDRSGSAYVQSLQESGAGSALTGNDYVRFDLDVQEAGTYRMWLLAQGDDSSSDSVWIQLDAQLPFQAVLDNSREWRWKTAASAVTLAEGFQTLTLHHRETGTRIDKILLVQDTAYRPEGL
ncbi:MAG: fibronectin type III domain-containing protein, partial [Arachnia sp.]